MRIIFFFDDTRIRTSEGHQDYKRTVYRCTRPQYVTAAVVYLPVLFFYKYISIFYEDFLFSYDDPWIQPTKTTLISRQSIY